MIRVNLLPVEEAQRAAGRRHELAIGTFAVSVAVFLFLVAHLFQKAQFSSANRELRRIGDELSRIQGPYQELTRLEQHKQELREKLRVIAELEARKIGPVRILADLSKATPDKLWLTEFSDAGGMLRLTGLGVDEQTVADFLRRLDTVPLLRSVDLDETSQVDQEGTKLKKFVIRGQLDYAGPVPQEAAGATAGKPGQAKGAER